MTQHSIKHSYRQRQRKCSLRSHKKLTQSNEINFHPDARPNHLGESLAKILVMEQCGTQP